MVKLLRSPSPLLLFLLFCLTLALILWSKVEPPVLAQGSFPDLQDHWAKDCVTALAQRKIVAGDANGNFRPNAPVTRAEYALMIHRAFPGQSQVRSALRFRDVSTGNPSAAAIQYTYQAGFLSGYPGGRFNPTEKIPRFQALGAMAAGLRAATQHPAEASLSATFTDAPQIPSYARGAIAAALDNRLIASYPDPTKLNPTQPITRSELASSLCLAMPETRNLIPTQYIAAIPRTAELRGVWLTNIDSEVLFRSEQLQVAVQELARLNFNTLYPTVWNWGYTLYPSPVAQQTLGYTVDPREPGLQTRDMLAEIVQAGHQRGLAVIPWFEFGFMAPADSELAKIHPDWLTQRQDGSQVWDEGIYPRVWLNPFHPEVQQFITRLMLEMVNRYDIDGIQLDDHFGLPVEFGYDPFTLQLYQQEHPGKVPPKNPQDAEWVRWRANKLTAYVKQLFETIKARKRKVLLALSPNPYPFAYNAHLQDWRTWEREGLIEELIVQIYQEDLQKFTQELNRPELVDARRHIPTGVGVLTGLKDRTVPIQKVQAKVTTIRQQGFSGMSFFFYETMWNLSSEAGDYRKSVFQSLFPVPLPRPVLPN